MADSSRIHPAVTVSNIKNFIPITLEMKDGPYGAWAELFRNHCRAFQVIEHILPSATQSDSSTQTTQTDTQTDQATWARLDAIVTQWIYGTISKELLLTILKTDQTARQAWDRVKSIFQDNEQSRTIQLRHEFSNIKLESFPNLSSYCQELKNISDQLNPLSSTGDAIKDEDMVLQLISGLSDSYQTIGTMIAHTKPTPTFYNARSMLILEESRKQHLASNSAINAGIVLISSTTQAATPPSTNTNNNRSNNYRGRGSYLGNNGRGRDKLPCSDQGLLKS
ncbi:uncharacterized protein [Rutidosis leptorrhynchoides]|uniref:uncharacterized protein n=1 Tax=Rutidosis leptorrhynchoides TaxID=125765 RepID=UPI003A99D195